MGMTPEDIVADVKSRAAAVGRTIELIDAAISPKRLDTCEGLAALVEDSLPLK